MAEAALGRISHDRKEETMQKGKAMSEGVYSAGGNNIATNERGGYSGLIYILLTGIFAVMALAIMNFASNSIRDSSYDRNLPNIKMAQEIFAGGEGS